MLPRVDPTVKRLRVLARGQALVAHVHAVLQRARPLAPVLAWGLGLWAAVIAVPFAFLYPDAGLDQPACLFLALLAPAGLVAAALSGGATAVLGVGLAGLVPPLVACPDLQGARTTGPLQALLVALLALGFVAAAWSAASRKALPGVSLRRLLVWPRQPVDKLLAVLGALWLLQAWWLRDSDPATAEESRGARVAGVALCWLAVRMLPLAGATPPADSANAGDRWPMFAGRRVSWLALIALLLWLWRNHV
jgi:hypothetical protein